MHRHNPTPEDVLCFSTEADYREVPGLIARAQEAGFHVRRVPAHAVGDCEVKIITSQTWTPGISVSGVQDDARAASIAAHHAILFVPGWDLTDHDTRTWFGHYLDAMIAARDGHTGEYEVAVTAMDGIYPRAYAPYLDGDSW